MSKGHLAGEKESLTNLGTPIRKKKWQRVVQLYFCPILSLPHLEGRTCYFYNYKSCSGSNCPLSTTTCKHEHEMCFSIYGYSSDGTLKVLEYNSLVNSLFFFLRSTPRKVKTVVGNKPNSLSYTCQSIPSQGV